MAYKFANMSGTVFIGNRRVALRVDEAWDVSADIVKQRPEMFNDDPSRIHGTPADVPVEQMTAAPGEKRATRRGK